MFQYLLFFTANIKRPQKKNIHLVSFIIMAIYKNSPVSVALSNQWLYINVLFPYYYSLNNLFVRSLYLLIRARDYSWR